MALNQSERSRGTSPVIPAHATASISSTNNNQTGSACWPCHLESGRPGNRSKRGKDSPLHLNPPPGRKKQRKAVSQPLCSNTSSGTTSRNPWVLTSHAAAMPLPCPELIYSMVAKKTGQGLVPSQRYLYYGALSPLGWLTLRVQVPVS